MCRDIRNWNGNSFSVVVGEGKKKIFFYFSFRSSFQEELQTPVEFGENSETSKSKLGKRKKTSLAGIEFDAPRCFHFPLRVFSFVRSTWWTIEREKRRGGGRPAVVEIFFLFVVCVSICEMAFSNWNTTKLLHPSPFFFFRRIKKKKTWVRNRIMTRIPHPHKTQSEDGN